MAGTQGSAAFDINDSGVIVGTSGAAESFNDIPAVVLWQNGSVTKIGQTGGGQSGGNIRHNLHINNNGHVVFAAAMSGSESIALWQNGNTTAVFSGYFYDDNLAFNDSGDIVFTDGFSEHRF